MGQPLRRGRVAVLAALLLAASALAGCGRKGPLELPPGAPPPPSEAGAAAQQSRVLNDADSPGLIQSPNKVYEQSAAAKQQVFQEKPAPPPINGPPAPKPVKGFFLDPLL